MSAIGRPGTRLGMRRWSVRLILAIAVLAQLFTCQAVLAPAIGATSVAIQDVGHGLGHDVVCEAAALAPAARALAPDCAPAAAAAVVLVALVVTSSVLAGRVGAGGVPSWSSQRLVPGRRRLLAVGIMRV